MPDRSEPISSTELLAQLLDAIDLLASSADQQLAWLRRKRYPMEELILNLQLRWPLGSSRLLESGIMTDPLAVRLDHLVAEATFIVNPAHATLFEPAQLRSAPEWANLREHAASIGAELRASLA